MASVPPPLHTYIRTMHTSIRAIWSWNGTQRPSPTTALFACLLVCAATRRDPTHCTTADSAFAGYCSWCGVVWRGVVWSGVAMWQCGNVATCADGEGITEYKPLTEIKVKLHAAMQALTNAQTEDAEELCAAAKKAIAAVRACVHACMRACVHACVRACVRGACVCACVGACVAYIRRHLCFSFVLSFVRCFLPSLPSLLPSSLACFLPTHVAALSHSCLPSFLPSFLPSLV